MDIAALQSQLHEKGYCCIEDVIPSHRVSAIRDKVASDVWANNQLAPPTGYVPGFLRFNQSQGEFALLRNPSKSNGLA